MIKSLLNYVSGWCTVSVSQEDVVDALNLLQNGSFIHWHMRNTKDGGICFRMLMDDSARYASLYEGAFVGRVHGMPALFRRYRGRWGILLGAIVFALIVFYSTTVVWRVDVIGNKNISTAHIIEMLSEFGFGIGTKFGSIDFDEMQNDFLLTTDEIAWIAVNMQGTVAKVEVRENLGGKGSSTVRDGAANIVAAEDGQILEIHLVKGESAVSRGDIVRRGDLLISGLLTIGEDGLRYEYGSGEVLAQVNRVIEVTSPLTRTEMVRTGRKTERKKVSFFDNEIKLFQNTNISYEKYDIIMENKQLSLLGGILLPVFVSTETVYEMAEESVTVPMARAAADAMILYREKMDALLAEAEILSIETEHSCVDGVYRIISRVVCIANIASTAEIPIR